MLRNLHYTSSSAVAKASPKSDCGSVVAVRSHGDEIFDLSSCHLATYSTHFSRSSRRSCPGSLGVVFPGGACELCSTGADLSIKNKSTTLPNGLAVRGSPPKKRNRIRIATRMLGGAAKRCSVLKRKNKINCGRRTKPLPHTYRAVSGRGGFEDRKKTR